jgi:hypothetical protein
MRFTPALLVLATIAAGCIEPSYVPGAPCFTSFECPPPPVETDDPVSTFPEQCVPTGAGTTICVPQPFSRPRTTCAFENDNSTCLAAGFPVEVQCLPDPDGQPNNELICQCQQLEETCQWDVEACTCSNAPVPI